MFIRKPYEDTTELLRNDEYVTFEDFNVKSTDERILPPLFPPGGPGNHGPSMPPPRPPRPNHGGHGPSMPPPRPPHPNPGGPGPVMPPPRPPYPNPGGPGPVMPPPRPPHPNPGGPGPIMPPPPPGINPQMPNTNLQKVSPGSIAPCRYQYVYIWLNNGNSFWAWPTNINYTTLSGYRWNGYSWVYFGIDVNRIYYFECYGRNLVRKEDNVVPYIKTQSLSPLSFNLEYPYIQGSSNENSQNIINEEIIKELDSLLLNEVLVPEKADFVKVASAYEVPLDANGILSIVMSLYTLTKGQKKGRTTFTSITTNINTGEVYSFDDLFNSKFNYRQFISEIAMRTAQQMDTDFIAPYDGVTEDQKFYLTPEELVLYYQVDEFTPATEGLFRIPIAYTEINSILGVNSPIKNLIQ